MGYRASTKADQRLGGALACRAIGSSLVRTYLTASVFSVRRRAGFGDFVWQNTHRANAQSLGARLFPGAIFLY